MGQKTLSHQAFMVEAREEQGDTAFVLQLLKLSTGVLTVVFLVPYFCVPSVGYFTV